MLIDNETLTLAVKKGAAWLDERRPDWMQMVNLDTVDMSSCFSCIVGQVFGDYEYLTTSRSCTEEGWSVAHGFTIPIHAGDRWQNWQLLRDAWADYIIEHR